MEPRELAVSASYWTSCKPCNQVSSESSSIKVSEGLQPENAVDLVDIRFMKREDPVASQPSQLDRLAETRIDLVRVEVFSSNTR